MPIQRLGGILGPADLALLQRVFDQLCSERHLTENDTEQREDLAGEIVSAFQSGITDETDLLQSARLRTA